MDAFRMILSLWEMAEMCYRTYNIGAFKIILSVRTQQVINGFCSKRGQTHKTSRSFLLHFFLSTFITKLKFVLDQYIADLDHICI